MVAEQGLVEILTRAVTERGRRRLTWSHTMPAEGARRILGVQVGSAALDLKYGNGLPVIDVQVDCDLWCAEDSNTRAYRTSARFSDLLADVEEFSHPDEAEIHISPAGSPRTVQATIQEGQVLLNLETEVDYEVIRPFRFYARVHENEGKPRARVAAHREAPRQSRHRRRVAISHFPNR